MRRTYTILPALAFVALVAGCNAEPNLETRTFPLQYLKPGTAQGLVEPYIYGDRPSGPGALSFTQSTMTVRETADNLDRIASVLAEYDVPSPWVRLSFQIIHANGVTTSDARIADVEAELSKLFRYEGYALLAEAVVSGTAESEVTQEVGPMRSPQGVMRSSAPAYYINVNIGEVRMIGDSGFVSMHVQLQARGGGGLSTRINARTGQTIVLGNAQMGTDSGTTILTVRPELISQ